MTRAFVDTNILVYQYSGDPHKADRAERLMLSGPHVSAQVLNEFARIARRKLGFSWQEIAEVVDAIESCCPVEPITLETHRLAVELAARHALQIFDASIVASALLAECKTLWSEDMHDGLRVQGLQIRNPFRA